RCLVRSRFAARFGQSLDCDEGARYIRCLSLLIWDLDILLSETTLATHPLQAHLGDRVMLLGYDLPQDTVHPGDNLVLTLYWQATAQMDKDYTVFVHVADEAGYAVAQNDAWPVDSRYPTSDWRTGTVLGDRVVVSIPPDTPPGEYQLRVGMYLLETMERLPVASDASGQNAVALGMVRVEEP
ncbi:MAG: hypothetical protein OEW09_07755, partial [Anaerolineae bacterium]|nr:hypothetical protein [Anaerolineae bacterium]